jgi:hypothetical protein
MLLTLLLLCIYYSYYVSILLRSLLRDVILSLKSVELAIFLRLIAECCIDFSGLGSKVLQEISRNL